MLQNVDGSTTRRVPIQLPNIFKKAFKVLQYIVGINPLR